MRSIEESRLVFPPQTARDWAESERRRVGLAMSSIVADHLDRALLRQETLWGLDLPFQRAAGTASRNIRSRSACTSEPEFGVAPGISQRTTV
jgi:hypothetical protein